MKENNRHSQEFFESDPLAREIRNVCLIALEMLSEILWTHPTGRLRYYAVLEMLDGALINLGISAGRQQLILDQTFENFARETAANLNNNAPEIYRPKMRTLGRDSEAAEVATQIAAELSNWLGRLCELTSDEELAATIDLFQQFFDAQSPENKV